MTDTNISQTGWAFPPAFSPGGGNIQSKTGAEKIKQSLRILFGTKIGERLNNPTYGCNLDLFLFEQLSQQLLINIEYAVRDAILHHQQRISDPKIQVTPIDDNGQRLLVKVDYVLPDSEQPDSLTIDIDLQGEDSVLGANYDD